MCFESALSMRHLEVASSIRERCSSKDAVIRFDWPRDLIRPLFLVTSSEDTAKNLNMVEKALSKCLSRASMEEVFIMEEMLTGSRRKASGRILSIRSCCIEASFVLYEG